LLMLTNIHPLFAVLGLNSCLNSFAVFASCLPGVLCLVLIVDILEGNLIVSLYAFGVNLAFFYTLSKDSKALGKGLILEVLQSNAVVFESFTRSRRYKVGWWEDFGSFLNLGR
jgi:hypothetical protein